jgi:hypothetical protein
VQWFQQQPKEFFVNGFHRWCISVTILNSLYHCTQIIPERISFEQDFPLVFVLSKRDWYRSDADSWRGHGGVPPSELEALCHERIRVICGRICYRISRTQSQNYCNVRHLKLFDWTHNRFQAVISWHLHTTRICGFLRSLFTYTEHRRLLRSHKRVNTGGRFRRAHVTTIYIKQLMAKRFLAFKFLKHSGHYMYHPL